MNKSQIFERVESGASMTLAYRELADLTDTAKGKYPKLIYSTFRRFVNREKAKTIALFGASAKAGKMGGTPLPREADEEPGSTRRKPLPLPVRKPKTGADGVDFSGTDSAEELFGPAPAKKSPKKKT